ncbi:hypothetical protein BDB01DRAFT_910144 [Pilobolus umbonatus]|nr:hypothetical protein BDB01DRAFT_910144 [Pilobolus umbonatus]
MELEYKRYYCLQLEDLANSESIPLYRCKGQWAAFLIMAQIMRIQNVVPHNEVAMDTREDRNMDRESSLDSLLCEPDHDDADHPSSSGAGSSSFDSSSFDYSHSNSYDNSGLDPLFNGMQSTPSTTPSNINSKHNYPRKPDRGIAAAFFLEYLYTLLSNSLFSFKAICPVLPQ